MATKTKKEVCKKKYEKKNQGDQIEDWFKPWNLMPRRYQARCSAPCKKCSVDDGGAASRLCARCEYYERQQKAATKSSNKRHRQKNR